MRTSQLVCLFLFGICTAQYAALVGYQSLSCKGPQVYVNYSPQCNAGVKMFCSGGYVNVTYYTNSLCTTSTFSIRLRNGTCVNANYRSFQYVCTSGPIEVDAEPGAKVYTIKSYNESGVCDDSTETGFTQYVANVCVDGIALLAAKLTEGIYVTCDASSAQMIDYQDNQECTGEISQSSNPFGTCSSITNALSPTPFTATTTCETFDPSSSPRNLVLLALIGFFSLLCL